MIKKQKSKFRILWYILPVFALLAISVVVVPPMIHLNFLKPKIEEAILSKTGIPVKIHGNVNVSLLGKATIVAHNITVPNGVISDCKFSIPFFSIFDIKNASVSDYVTINNASFLVNKIKPFDMNIDVVLNDSKIKFLNKEYKIINANLSKDHVNAIVRTDQHKYEIQSKGNKFTIKNHNNNLILTGELLPDGTANAHINITALDINRWFEFDKPRIKGQFPIDADLKWNGSYGIDFYNISANGVTGNAILQEDGYKIINLKSDSADYDMSFIGKNPEILKSMALNLDFHGEMTFVNKPFKHIKIATTGSNNEIKIDTFILDDITVHGGTIDENGAHDVTIEGPLSGLHTKCLFNGTPTDWFCREFSHGSNITSVFSVKDDVIDADVYSTTVYADMKPFVVTIRKLASSGEVRFYYPDMDGTLHLKKDSYTVDYTRLENRSLNQAKINLKFLPNFMKDETGDFVWVNGVMIFTPDSKQWQLSKSIGFFILRGENFKRLTKKIDLQAFNDLPYVLSGNYKNGNISDLLLEIANHKFTGSASKNSVTLKTDVLNVDLFTNKSFMQNFEELSFFTNHPMLLPFEANIDFALSAKTMIYDNEKYNNFMYSLHKDIQTFSISDSNRGNLLASIKKNHAKYDINIQLNQFVFNKKLLPSYATLNISDSTVTAEIKLKTFGKIAHDIVSNLNGTFDASFDGGKLYGLGFDKFYASAQDISTVNGEEFLSLALSDGITQIKKMRIIGSYAQGDIKTLYPLTLSMKHVDASGNFEITDKNMFVKLNLLLRGTSTSPEPIELTINSNNSRDFSLSETMLNFDPEYMRVFVQTHGKF